MSPIAPVDTALTRGGAVIATTLTTLLEALLVNAESLPRSLADAA